MWKVICAIMLTYRAADLRVDGDVSPIKKFNGVDVVEYITKEMEHQTFHDPDARWNTLFAREQAWSDGAWIFPYTYPGGNTTATFANGSSITLVNTATPNDDSAWFSVVDGETFYETFVAPVSSPSVGTVSSIPKRHPLLRRSEMINARTQDTKILEKRKVPPNYPAPVVQHSQVDTEIGAFFLDGEGLDDVAVLSMNTFDTDSGEAHIEFQALVEDFIALAKSEGKTKIIIDVSSNGGGSLFMGFDIFKQFFPELEPAIDNRFPVTDVNMILGEQMGTIDEKKTDMEFVWENGFTPYDAYFSHLHWASNTDENDKQYTSWDQMKGPVMLNDYPMSEVMRYNFSYPFHADGGIDDITGYGTRKNNNKQPFESENIVIVSDGYCSSTCSIFVDLMKNQGNVRTFALGGRPQFGPMQTVGGTKGAILTGWEEIASQVQTVLNFFGTASDRAKWAKKLPLAWPINMSGFSAPIANGRSAYHRGSDTPLQFLNETANCRLFYTPAMLQNVTNIWDTVARVAWDIEGGTGQKCVAGSETDGKPLGEIVSKKTPAGADIDGVDGDNSAAKEHDDDPEGAAPGGAAVCLFTLTFGLLVTGLAYL